MRILPPIINFLLDYYKLLAVLCNKTNRIETPVSTGWFRADLVYVRMMIHLAARREAVEGQRELRFCNIDNMSKFINIRNGEEVDHYSPRVFIEDSKIFVL